jgi:hypothetical protein
MRDVREALRFEEPHDLDRARLAHAREVVPAEVDQHHVLGTVLLRREQPLDVVRPTADGACDRVHARTAAVELHQRLG